MSVLSDQLMNDVRMEAERQGYKQVDYIDAALRHSLEVGLDIRAFRANRRREKQHHVYPVVECDKCGRKVKENVIVRHLKSGCRYGVGMRELMP